MTSMEVTEKGPASEMASEFLLVPMMFIEQIVTLLS